MDADSMNLVINGELGVWGVGVQNSVQFNTDLKAQVGILWQY